MWFGIGNIIGTDENVWYKQRFARRVGIFIYKRKKKKKRRVGGMFLIFSFAVFSPLMLLKETL